ncbi:MAG: protein kinase domain-containing protein [Planctomycetaceae bacterium]
MSAAPDGNDPAPSWPRRSGFAGLVGRGRRPAGAETMKIVGSLAALDPPPEAPVDIPGLSDLEEIGRGGMGVVYRARETRLGRTVAVKVLAGRVALTDEGRLRAERESALLTRVVHPNIVQILYVTDVAGVPAIVMEWIDGPAIDTLTASRAMPVSEAVAIVADLARGVAALHAGGIVHRDIKPANVLLALPADRGRPVPKLIDFGLARPGDEAGPSLTRECTAIGTPAFMAAEQTGLDPSLGPVGPAADIHALGGILYWLLSGRAPYDADNASSSLHRAAAGDATPLGSLLPRLPADVDTIVATCLERHPAARYASAAALAEDLTRFLDHRPILARPASAIERTLKWARRRPAVAALVAGALVAVLAVSGGAAYHLRRLQVATVALEAGRDQLIQAQALARKSFERLTDASAERLLARGAALDAADRDHLRQIRDEYLAWPMGADAVAGLRYRAAGLVRLARIFERLGWTSDVLDTVRMSLACHDGLEARGGTSPAGDRERAEAMRLEIATLARNGRVEEALAAARGAVGRWEGRALADFSARRLLALAWGDLANVETSAGLQGESRDHRRRAIELADALLAEDPDDGDLLRLSLPIFYNAAISPSSDDGLERSEFVEKLLARAGDGLDRFQDGREEMGRGVLLALTMLAQLELEQGRPEAALEVVRRRAAAARTLAAEMPAVHHFRDEVVGAACQIATCQAALGRPEDAAADLDEAVAMSAAAVVDEPAVAERTRVLLDVLFVRARMFLVAGRSEAAIADLRRVLDAVAPWIGGPEDGRDTPVGFAAAADTARANLARITVAMEATGP